MWRWELTAEERPLVVLRLIRHIPAGTIIVQATLAPVECWCGRKMLSIISMV